MVIQIENIQDDITKVDVDAIVNAANKTLLGGGGVDGAIHQAAGPKLLEACKTLGGAETGEAKLTEGYQLPADYVIHTVGPVYEDGQQGEAEELEGAYRNSLLVAEKERFEKIAFPAISTGAYGYPKKAASKIAFQTVKKLGKEFQHLKKVIFVNFDKENFNLYEDLLTEEKKGE